MENNKLNILHDKRGGEKYLSIWWIFILVVIAGGIVLGVSIFYSADIDVRSVEADILSARVIDCIMHSGQVDNEFMQKGEIFKKCDLSEEIINKSGKYLLKIEVYKNGDCKLEGKIECKNPLIVREFGVSDFKNQCEIKKSMKKAENYPECSEKYLFALSETGEKLILYVLTGSNQYGKKEIGI